MSAERYVLVDGDRGWIYLALERDATPAFLIGGEVGSLMTRGRLPGWWETPGKPTDVAHALHAGDVSVVVVKPPGRRLSGYALAEGLEGVARPHGPYEPNLSVEAFAEFAATDQRAEALYEAVYEETPGRVEPVEGPWLALAGAPPPADELGEWVAALPSALRRAPEYAHLFPGHFAGFREHVKRSLAALDGVSAFANAGPLSVYVKVELPRLERVQWQVPPTVGKQARRRSTGEARETITRHLAIPLSDRVEGANRAEAAERWRVTAAEIVQYVSELVASPCPHCAGRGWLEGEQALDRAAAEAAAGA